MWKTTMRPGLSLVVLVLALSYLTGCGADAPPSDPNPTRLDFSAVTGLLGVLRATVAASPNVDQFRARLASLDGPRFDSLVDSLITAKSSDIRLGARIDALLSSPAYRLYYRQFGNMNAEKHRRILLALPYVAVPSPADISSNLLEITNHLDSLTAWADSLGPGIDMDFCRLGAEQWLPPGEYKAPLTYFILDGNGDAFALDGEVGFDLYSLLLNKRPLASRYENLDEVSVDVVQGVMAHEYHHTFADRHYAKFPTKTGDWKSSWYDRMVRRMVQEGTAMHCNPPTGFNRDIKIDTTTVVAWIRSLNVELAAIKDGRVAEEAAREWMNHSYYDNAMAMLRFYLGRTFQGDELTRQVNAHSSDRPSLVYTLGWWMVSRLSQDGTNPGAVRELVANPTTLVEKYNATLPPGADSLRFPVF